MFQSRMDLARVEAKLDRILKQGNLIMATLQDITNAVSAETTADQSIITLLNGIVAQLQAAQGDPDQIATIVSNIQANTAAITAAVTANTPVVTVPSTSTGTVVPSGTTVTTAPSTGASQTSVPASTN